jgi:hypothetical protein
MFLGQQVVNTSALNSFTPQLNQAQSQLDVRAAYPSAQRRVLESITVRWSGWPDVVHIEGVS